MAYITRDDGINFVVPSYRDVISTKQKATLKKDINTLSQSYGEYITLQKKGTSQYEVSFSPDSGYLLGESIWHHFKRPLDLIYCEVIPNSNDVILVVVKAGSVYLDGRFPAESIPEELIIFLPQQNNFEIYIYGQVPISELPEMGKINFEKTSIKSFTVLDQPVFPSLELYKIYQLRLVDSVLKEQGIGTFPIKPLLYAAALIGLFYLLFHFYHGRSTSQSTQEPITAPNPYAAFINELNAPDLRSEINGFIKALNALWLIPGWQTTSVTYVKGNLTASLVSSGVKVQTLLDWAQRNHYQFSLNMKGIKLNITVPLINRPPTKKIYALNEVLAQILDRLVIVYPGNHIQLGDLANKGVYSNVLLTLTLESVTQDQLRLIADQLTNLPVILQSATFTVEKGLLTGNILINALGN